MVVRGTASGTAFHRYRLEYGEGPSPASWHPIGGTQPLPVADGVLGVWETQRLRNGLHMLQLTVEDSSGGTRQVRIAVEVAN